MSLSLIEARECAIQIEQEANLFGWHVGLSGGVLYKDGPRKDTDFFIYEHKPGETKHENLGRFMALLTAKGIETMGYPENNVYSRFVVKAYYKSKPIDLIFITNLPPTAHMSL